MFVLDCYRSPFYGLQQIKSEDFWFKMLENGLFEEITVTSKSIFIINKMRQFLLFDWNTNNFKLKEYHPLTIITL